MKNEIKMREFPEGQRVGKNRRDEIIKELVQNKHFLDMKPV